MEIYLPTTFGDISLAPEDNATIVRTTDLTLEEKGALVRLLTRYKITHDVLENAEIRVSRPHAKVATELLKFMKGNATLVFALRSSEGKVEEVKTLEEAQGRDAVAAVGTAVPHRGCPMPIYKATLEKEIRGTRVLGLFLNDAQKQSYDRSGSFVVRGGDSGHQFMVCHRWSLMASKMGLVYDLNRGKSICVEKSQLPPSEEMLALRLVLGFPGRETAWIESL